MDSATSLHPVYADHARLIAEIVSQCRREDPIISPEFVSPNQAAIITDFTRKALERMRQRGIGPTYSKVGKSIRYAVSDLRAWMEAGRVE